MPMMRARTAVTVHIVPVYVCRKCSQFLSEVHGRKRCTDGQEHDAVGLRAGTQIEVVAGAKYDLERELAEAIPASGHEGDEGYRPGKPAVTLLEAIGGRTDLFDPIPPGAETREEE